MKRITGSALLVLLIAIIFTAAFSCSRQATGTITQEEYDALKAQLTATEAQLSAAQAKIVELETAAGQSQTTGTPDTQALNNEIASLQAQVKSLSGNITQLTSQNSALTQAKASLEAQYADLAQKYGQLQQTLAALATPAPITEDQVETAIFNALSQERVNAGIPAFAWGKNLYLQAKSNSKLMAESGVLQEQGSALYEEVLLASGYDSAESIARGATLTWKLNQYRFDHGVLLVNNKYAAVGAYKSEDIFYITFVAAFYP